MRYKGYTRPLSIFKIRADVRSRYSRMSEHAMMDMLTPICMYYNVFIIVVIGVHVLCKKEPWSRYYSEAIHDCFA